MAGATGNIYCGLHEFEDMALVLHALRPGDLFVDIGANIGSYTILAAGACGANVLAAEPVPSTFAQLCTNIRLNGLEHLVTPKNVAVGAKASVLRMSSDLDTVNHVVSSGEVAEHTVEVQVDSLDSLLGADSAALIKIDTEGYETEVIAGAQRVLSSSGVLAILVELNGSGARYGFDEYKLHLAVVEHGFNTYAYDPIARKLTAMHGARNPTGNTLYVRDVTALEARIKSAPRHHVHGTTL
jgi:FkbM family methyltransferase